MHADVALDLLVEAVQRGHPQRMRALGTSMSSAIPNGAWIEIEPLGSRGVQMGDVVAVRAPRVGLLVHRVCGLRADGAVLVKGDRCPRPDGWFSRHDVFGRVVRMAHGDEWSPVPLAPRPPPSQPVVQRLVRRLRAVRLVAR